MAETTVRPQSTYVKNWRKRSSNNYIVQFWISSFPILGAKYIYYVKSGCKWNTYTPGR